MTEQVSITFTVNATAEQEVSILRDSNGDPVVTKEELVNGLKKGEFFTSMNIQANPYIIRILNDGYIQNIAVIEQSRICTEEETDYSDFILDDDE